MNADPNLSKTWEYEDPNDLIHNLDATSGHSDPFDPGYKPLATGEDVKNISNAVAKTDLKIADDAPCANCGNHNELVKPPQLNQPTQSATAPGGRQPQQGGTPINPTNKQVAGYQTQILAPGEIKYTSNQAPKAGALQGKFSLDQLKAEILDKRKLADYKANVGTQAPVSGKRPAVGGKKLETEIVTPGNVDALTPQEIAKFTPDDIKNLPPAFRDKLPMNQLSARQLQALADSGTLLTNERISSLTPETIGRLPQELRDLLPVDQLSGNQLKALANSMGLPTSGPTAGGLAPLSGSVFGGTGRQPVNDNGVVHGAPSTYTIKNGNQTIQFDANSGQYALSTIPAPGGCLPKTS